jgi:hypothetical protein
MLCLNNDLVDNITHVDNSDSDLQERGVDAVLFATKT